MTESHTPTSSTRNPWGSTGEIASVAIARFCSLQSPPTDGGRYVRRTPAPGAQLRVCIWLERALERLLLKPSCNLSDCKVLQQGDIAGIRGAGS